MKTLKDFETDSCSIDSFRVADCDELKKSAIEDIREIIKGYPKHCEYAGRPPSRIVSINAKVDYIKRKFNITEEEWRK